MKVSMYNDLTLTDQARDVLSCVDTAKAKAASKRRAPSSSVSEKLQKMDLSLEAYIHVLLSVQQGPQLLLKLCPMENLRKVLLANNFSPLKATKEFVTSHLHDVPLFKPFFSSVQGSKNNLRVKPMGINHVDLLEDLNALEWLEYGRALVEVDAQSLLGISVEDAPSSTGHPLLKTPNCRQKSHVTNLHLTSHNGPQNITKKFSCKSQVNSIESRSVSCQRSDPTKPYLPLCTNLHKSAQNNGHEADLYVINLEPGLSAPECHHYATAAGSSPSENNWCKSTGKVHYESRSTSCFTSAAPNPCVSFNSQQKNMEKKASKLVSVIDLDPPQCTTQACVFKAEVDKNPWSSQAFMKSGMNVTSAKTSHQQLDVVNSSSSSIVHDKNVHPSEELTLLRINKKGGQNTPSSTSQPQSQDMTQDVLEQLVSTQKEGEKALIENFQDGMAHDIMQLSSPEFIDRNEEKSTLSNRSTSDMSGHDFTQPVYIQNFNREAGNNVFINSNSSSQSSNLVRELEQYACIRPLHSKEENTMRRASQPGMSFLDRVSPPCSIMTKATDAFVISSPSYQQHEAAHNPVQLASPKSLDHAAGEARILSNRPPQDARLVPAPEMEELNFDAASAGFLAVLSDSAASTLGSKGALTACIENSLDLLEEWEKRKQKSSEVRGRTKTKMQEEKERNCKRVHLQLESENGNGSSFYSQAAIAERCSSLREETAKLLSEYGQGYERSKQHY